MHRPGIFHLCRQNLLIRDAIAPRFFIPADRIFSSGMHRPRIFHPCRQNLLGRDASPRHFSSLQTESPRQGCIAPGFFILADKIPSAGMHRPRIFHPCRQNLLVRERISPSGMHRPGIFHLCRQNLLARDASPPQLYPRFPSAPSPDKADSSDFQTAGFRSR